MDGVGAMSVPAGSSGNGTRVSRVGLGGWAKQGDGVARREMREW